MDATRLDAVREVKARVRAMLSERRELAGQERALADPSAYWSEACEYFDYLLDLPEACFGKLRLHTYHLSGDHYQTYLFDVGRRAFLAGWRELVRGLPADMVLSEPAHGGFGFDTGDGHVVSADVVRYQRVVRSLHRAQALHPLSVPDGGRAVVLEVGAGYGALLHHVTRLKPGALGVIVDLPETLLFSGTYLSFLHAPERVYVYEPTGYQQVLRSGFAGYDFLLFPNYRLPALGVLRFDLALNVASLQEMRVAQARSYLDFLAATCRGVFYSCNQDAQPRNAEPLQLSRLLQERFDLEELRPVVPRSSATARARAGLLAVLRAAARFARLLERPEKDLLDAVPYREFLCRPRRA